MFPNATRGYMPFVNGKKTQESRTHSAIADYKRRTLPDSRTRANKNIKAYKVTLHEKNGYTYTYIIKADNTSKSLPSLGGAKLKLDASSLSLPNIQKLVNSTRQAYLFDKQCRIEKKPKKKGFFSSIINFLSSKSKSNLKAPRPPPQRKRTVSNISNLDPIQESPDEYEDDDSSYTHSDSDDSLSCGIGHEAEGKSKS